MGFYSIAWWESTYFGTLAINYFVQCQNTDFHTELCCNTIIHLFALLFIVWIPILPIIFENTSLHYLEYVSKQIREDQP